MKRIFILLITLSFFIINLSSCVRMPKRNFASGKESSSSENSAKKPEDDFTLNVFSDKNVYKEDEKIEIWATFKYIGLNDKLEIWHGEPYITFSITNGKDFNIVTITDTVLKSSILNRNELYSFDYDKNMSYDDSDSNAEFWKKFADKKGLYLPKGEYTIGVSAEFATSNDALNDKISLKQDVKITVE